MPKQYMVFGRPMPRITTRRLTLGLFALSLLALISLSTTTSRLPAAPSLADIEEKLPTVPNIKLPDKITKSKYNPWRIVAHPPPRQKFDEYEGASWWSDYKWLSIPFSSTLSNDDDRSLLPPVPSRPPVYCYYDAEKKKPRAEKDAESQLLLTWRRAWWAQGFQPIIIGPTEAIGNSLYAEVQYFNLKKDIMDDMMRWLAWDTLGAGLLAQCTTFPMEKMEDNTLKFLRKGSYPSVTRWNGLESGLVAGMKDDVREVLKSIMNPTLLENVKTVLDAINPKFIMADKDASALAYYSPTVQESYGLKRVALKDESKEESKDESKEESKDESKEESKDESKDGSKDGSKDESKDESKNDSETTDAKDEKTDAKADDKKEDKNDIKKRTEGRVKKLQDLDQLINAHLHVTWQNIFKGGVEVLKPYPKHTSAMVQEAMDYAKVLVTCPQSPVPDSCPPNRKKCTPCKDKTSAQKVSTPEVLTNKSSVFTIGTVPHPWTLAVMDNMKENIDVPFIVRKAPRDPWLSAITQGNMGGQVSASARIISFKDSVAGQFAAAHNLWLQAEIDTPTDLAWRFGFAIPEVPAQFDDTPKKEGEDTPKEKPADEKKEAGEKKDADEKKDSEEEGKDASTDGEKESTDGEKDKSGKDEKAPDQGEETTDSPKKESSEKGDDKTDSSKDGKDAAKEEVQNDGDVPLDKEEHEQGDGDEKEEHEIVEENTAEAREREQALLESARKVVALKKSTAQTKNRASLEAWSMADAEAWRFAKAFLARRLLERVQWEKEEAKYAGGAGSEGGRNTFNRWQDLKEGQESPDETEDDW